jgi:hypothetical protein
MDVLAVTSGGSCRRSLPKGALPRQNSDCLTPRQLFNLVIMTCQEAYGSVAVFQKSGTDCA